MVDLHCHLLPGIDDGPIDLQASADLARACLAAGTDRVAATPHVNQRHQNDAARIEHARTGLEEHLERLSIALTVEAGAEISTSALPGLGDEELARLSLGGGDWLLVEPADAVTPFVLQGQVFELHRRGFRTLIAHPERIPVLQDDLDLMGALVAAGARGQVTAESFTGGFGPTAQRAAFAMLDRGLVHVASSDAHHATARGPDLRGHLRRAGLEPLTEWLCELMPLAVLDGGPEPERPAFERRRGGFLGRLRPGR